MEAPAAHSTGIHRLGLLGDRRRETQARPDGRHFGDHHCYRLKRFQVAEKATTTTAMKVAALGRPTTLRRHQTKLH